MPEPYDTAIRLDLLTEEVTMVGPRLKYAVPAKRYPSIADFSEPFDIRFAEHKEVSYDLRHLILGEKVLAVYVPTSFVESLGPLTAVIDDYAEWRERTAVECYMAAVNELLGIEIAIAVRTAAKKTLAEWTSRKVGDDA